MSPPSEDKLLSFLAEIRSDIRQIKSDLQALLTLLKQQQEATPSAFSDGDPVGEPAESGRSGSPEDVLRYLRETEEMMIRENSPRSRPSRELPGGVKHLSIASLPGFDRPRVAVRENGTYGRQGKAVGFPILPAALLSDLRS
jgi:hypothetical protein